MPPVSVPVRIPFSYNSIAKAITDPAEIESSPARLQISPALIIDSVLLLAQFAPNTVAVSYSGRRLPASYRYSPSPAFSIPLHLSGQCQQPCPFSTRVANTSGCRPARSGRSITPTPPQFLTGASPLYAELYVPKLVPYLCILSMVDVPVESGMLKYLICSIIGFCAAPLPAMGTSIFPRATTAFNFFEPITAPSPDRAAVLPWSVIIPAINDNCSPAGPIQIARD